jgi:hypothetical protein
MNRIENAAPTSRTEIKWKGVIMNESSDQLEYPAASKRLQLVKEVQTIINISLSDFLLKSQLKYKDLYILNAS